MNPMRMLKSIRRTAGAVLGAVLLLAALTAARAQTVSLGTLVPEGTSYYKSLEEMGAKWRKIPGAPRLRIYGGGKLGGEAKMVNQMRLGALEAGLLTVVGLAEIERGVTGLQNMPMMFRSLEEVDYVGENLKPMLEKRLAERGFIVLFWTDAGWVRFFSKEPVILPDDLRKMKLFTWAGDPVVVELWKSGGFNPVPLETAQIVPMLDTGLINATTMPPIGALSTQAYTRTPHMLDLNWAPLIGALVLRKSVWDKFPPATRAAMLKTAEEAGAQNKLQGRVENEKSVTVMKEKGLIVHEVTPEIERQWREAAEQFYPRIRGGLVPEDIFAEVGRLLKEYRAGQRGGKP